MQTSATATLPRVRAQGNKGRVHLAEKVLVKANAKVQGATAHARWDECIKCPSIQKRDTPFYMQCAHAPPNHM